MRSFHARFGAVRLALGLTIVLAVPCLTVTPVGAQLPATPLARKAAVERSLLQAIELEGQPAPTFTIAERMKHYKVPGVSVAVIHDGKIDWAAGYGLADVRSGRKVTVHTLFQAASMSKPVAALAVLKLVQRGRLSLDEDVNRVLGGWKVPVDSFTEKHPVTLRELLTHTAGLTVHGFAGYAAGEPVPTVVQVLEGAKPANSAPVVADIQPGTQWRYSGGGYTVMQFLVTEQYGEPFPQIMRGQVLDPLGMNESTYQQPLPAAKRPLAATGYRSNGNPVEGNYHTYPEMAAAGLWTSASDYARYVMGIQETARGERSPVLSRDMVDTMLTPGIGGWGLGPQIARDGDSLVFEHGGANEGFRSQFIGYVHSGEGIVVFTNSDAGSPLAQEIILAAAHVYGWPGIHPGAVHAVRLTPDALDAFVGKYAIPDAGGATIAFRRERDHLVLSFQGQEQPLVATGPAGFVTLDSGQLIIFERDAAGHAVAARLAGIRAVRVDKPE